MPSTHHATAPSRHILAIAVLAIVLAALDAKATFSLVPIPGPIDADGKAIPIVRALMDPFDRLIAADTGWNPYVSLDTGRSWTPISVPGDRGIAFSGSWLMTVDDSLMYRENGWVRVARAVASSSCSASSFSPQGYQSCYESATGEVAFYRSRDTLRTWGPWFRVPDSTLDRFDLTTDARADGVLEGGYAWWPVKDSNLWMGTNDGTNWVRIPVPALRSPYLHLVVDDTLYLEGESADGALLGLLSIDSGLHWDSVPSSLPGGGSLYRMQPGRWLTTSWEGDDWQKRRTWLGASCKGPWEAIPDSVRGIAVSGNGDVLVMIEDWIAWLVPATATLAMPTMPKGATAILRMEHGRWIVAWPAGSPEGPWKLVGADGRIFASGRLARGQKESTLPGIPSAGWLVLPGRESPLRIPWATGCVGR